MSFYLISTTGIDLCWDEGGEMLQKEVIVSAYLHRGSRGSINKKIVMAKLLSGEWDLRPASPGHREEVM